tara:strand:- start:9415 stop:9588 length:174 start_codon:yes stop_codon:yes gene_type:complete
MQINYKSLWVFAGVLAVVISTHAELLVRLPEPLKDIVTLASLAIIAMNNKVIEKSNE